MKNNLHKIILVVFLFSLITEIASCQLYDWRGPDRTGVYNETNLLKEWPEKGPELLWEIDGIGTGFSSVTISENSIYITGKKEEVDVLTALTLDGKKINEESIKFNEIGDSYGNTSIKFKETIQHYKNRSTI